MIKLSVVVASATLVLLGAQGGPALASAGPRPESPSLSHSETAGAAGHRGAGHLSDAVSWRVVRRGDARGAERSTLRASTHPAHSTSTRPGHSTFIRPAHSSAVRPASRSTDRPWPRSSGRGTFRSSAHPTLRVSVRPSAAGGASATPSTPSTAWPGEPAQLSVVGHGSVQAPPDVMRLSVGVEVRRDRASSAFSAAKAARARLAAAVQGAGISVNDMRTENLTLGAEYKDGPQVVGYRAAQGVEVILRDMSRADAVIDAVAAVGDEVQINGISFEVSKAEALLARARAAAYRDALSKARQLAALAGRHVGRVVKIDEQSDSTPRFSLAGADAAFVSPGQSSISVIVNVVYELV
ncbi:SIMPL domain-containing protein [Nonomuraea sp. NPDC050691]|uniref:SIMPL domain-containing protein n=1 Tax=Nonomuraea sp. NPDC050691 TaxID=3155661 RepID=UPI0033D0E8D6